MRGIGGSWRGGNEGAWKRREREVVRDEVVYD